MRRTLNHLACAAALALSGCSTLDDWGAGIAEGLGGLPLMYRPDIQQGNVLEQTHVNRLELGMSKNQVRYTMGTPMLTHVFHQDRWDYIYMMRRPGEPVEQKRVTLFFQDDRLILVEGDMQPVPGGDIGIAQQSKVVPVPDYRDRKQGVLDNVLESVGLGPDD
jgi:outer membrane protein assembly factor BamE